MRALPMLLVVVVTSACGEVEEVVVPKFVTAHYIDPAVLASVSLFRSGEGHDYSDSVEECRSMKHYFMPKGGDPGRPHDPSWATIPLFAPADGTVSKVEAERAGGTQVHVVATEAPAFTLVLFHVKLDRALAVGDVVTAGQRLGTLAGDDTNTDLAIRAVPSFNTDRLVSYFDALTDDLFADYRAEGAAGREAFVISREARDADPLQCRGERFDSPGSLSGWVALD